ncbi:MAG: hypothetical protein Aurels2KO_45490 [Aureliella sp.]
MNDVGASTQATKRFSLEEARAMLPLVNSIVSDIADIFQRVTGRRADLHRLMRGNSRQAGSAYDDEVAESRADLQEEYDKIWLFREELESLGVTLRQSETGEIEFPTLVDGVEAYFSWRLGEETISHWRLADSPASTRQQIRFDAADHLLKSKSLPNDSLSSSQELD